MTDVSNPRETAGKPAARRKVLLVDDNEGNLMAMTLLLRRGSVDSVSAEDGAAAIELLKSEPFDLLVSDVDMPNMSGFELLDWVKENKPGLPVLLMSGSASGSAGQTTKRALEQGARGVLAKPFVPGELERALAEILH
jgi:CheY-like chemotaxis protein